MGMFEVSGDVVDGNSFYQGHILLCRRMAYVERISYPVFPHAKTDPDFVYEFEGLFSDSLRKEFLKTQRTLAEKYLKGKFVNLFQEDGRKSLSNFFVHSIQEPDFQDRSVLFRIALDFSNLDGPVISEKMKIQIVG